MPFPPDDFPPGSQILGDPPVDVAPLYAENDFYQVVGVTQHARFALDGREIPTMDVSFEALGYPGVFEIFIDNYAFTHADPLRDLRGRVKRIRRLWLLPNPPPPDPEEL